MERNVSYRLQEGKRSCFLSVAEFSAVLFWGNFGVGSDPSSYFTFHQQAASTGSTSAMEIWAEGNGMKWKTSSNIFTFETGLIWPFVILSETELLKYAHPLLWPYITVIYHRIFSVG